MADRRKKTHRTAVEELPGDEPDMCKVVIPATVVVERMGSERKPVAAYAPSSEAAQSFATLWSIAWVAARDRKK